MDRLTRERSFSQVAAKLATEGPYKQEPTNRRIRALVGTAYAFDTLQAQFVWEHSYCTLTLRPRLMSIRC